MAGPAPSARTIAAFLSVAPDQPADHLTIDHQRGEGRDEPEQPERDGFRSDGALGLCDIGNVRGRSSDGSEVGDELVDSGDDGRFVFQSSVEMERDIGVEGAACLELFGQRWV